MQGHEPHPPKTRMPHRRNTFAPSSQSRHVGFGVLALAALGALAACSSDRVTAPAAPAPSAAALSKGPGEEKDAPKRLSDAQLTAVAPTFRTTSADMEAPTTTPLPLSCGFMGRYMVSQRVGKGGGSLRFGRSELRVPSGALAGDVQLTADISLSKEGVKVDFGPHGLKFAKAAELRVDYTGCTAPAGSALNVYYTDDANRIVQTMPSAADPSAKKMRALTDHFSGFVVSWGRR